MNKPIKAGHKFFNKSKLNPNWAVFDTLCIITDDKFQGMFKHKNVRKDYQW